jgi:hypothetical protein
MRATHAPVTVIDSIRKSAKVPKDDKDIKPPRRPA